jgi:hypothetical protein
MKRSCTVLLALIGLVAFTGNASASQTTRDENKRRGDLTYQIVKKWGAYVQDTYSQPARRWAMEMVPLFRASSLDAMQHAANAKTFDAMNDALLQTNLANGGQTDLKAITSQTVSTTKALGAVSSDLVFTPIQPCRILDTRVMGGPIASNFTRSFVGLTTTNFTAQGGSATDCGTLNVPAAALALTISVVNPVVAPAGGGGPGTGFLTIFPFGTAQPTAASILYKDAVSLNNSAIVQIPTPRGSADFTVYASQTTNVVADIVGYFAPPFATALDCATVSGTPTSVAAGAYASLPTLFCAANYTPVALSISAGENVLVADSYTAGNAGQIFVRSLSTNAQNVTAKLMCCRVPGR